MSIILLMPYEIYCYSYLNQHHMPPACNSIYSPSAPGPLGDLNWLLECWFGAFFKNIIWHMKFVFCLHFSSCISDARNNLWTLTLNEDEANMIPCPGDANRNGIPRNEMALNLQIAFSNSFSAMKSALLYF